MKLIPGLGLLLLLLMIAAIAGCERAQSQTPPPGAKPPPPEVFYTLPETKEITDYEDFTGHTEALKTVTVRSRVSGYLMKVNFVDGAEVKQNDVLFEIDSRPFTADLKNKEALVVQSERHNERLKSDYDRAQKTVASRSISQEQFDQYRFDYIESQSALQAAIASRDSSQLNVDFTKVLAPITGQVSRRLVDPGNLVLADNTPLTTVVSEDPIKGVFDVDEHTLLRVRRLVDNGTIKKDADSPVMLGLSDETEFAHKGAINFVDNQVDVQTGTLQFYGVFPNPDHFLTPGLFIRVRLPIGKPYQALVVPEASLGTDQGRKYVYVVNEKNEAIHTEVDVGAPYPGGRRVIEKGLRASDRIVASGLQRIARNGVIVVPKELKAETASKSEKSNTGEKSSKPPDQPPAAIAKPADNK
jgi:membrane fusion protein, multidrug efflux system